MPHRGYILIFVFQACHKHGSDIIVTELLMPNCHGRQFLQDFKQNPRTRDIPLVAVTGPDELASELRQLPNRKSPWYTLKSRANDVRNVAGIHWYSGDVIPCSPQEPL
jgi:CheY-like chemotaxis protein